MFTAPIRLRTIRSFTIAAASLLVCTACTASPNSPPDTDGNATVAVSADQTPNDDALIAAPTTVQDTIVLAGGSSAELAEEAVRTFFDSAPVVVIAAPGDELRAASAAVALGVPVLIDGPHITAEVDRLGATVALALGAVNDPGIDVVVPDGDTALAELIGAADASEGAAVPVGEQIAALVDLDATSPRILTPDGGPDGSASSQTDSPAAALESDRDRIAPNPTT